MADRKNPSEQQIAREIKSHLSFAKKTEGIKHHIIVTNEEERTISKDDLTIEVI